jgi:hypothetical protein
MVPPVCSLDAALEFAPPSILYFVLRCTTTTNRSFGLSLGFSRQLMVVLTRTIATYLQLKEQETIGRLACNRIAIIPAITRDASCNY